LEFQTDDRQAAENEMRGSHGSSNLRWERNPCGPGRDRT
jgi:hypothetical protein